MTAVAARAIVFVGPTLGEAEASADGSLVFRPPAGRGDIYAASLLMPRAIGLVDACFETGPSVLHREILWAMSQGIHLFGAGSLGALRAVELAPVGMQGVGWVYEAFRTGRLAEDDEVVVAFGSSAAGQTARSEAMVDIRRTLDRAAEAGILGPATAAALAGIGKGLFYPRRTYARLLAAGARAGLPAAELRALRGWLPSGRVYQRRDDARAMLTLMRERLAAGLEPMQVRYRFEYTSHWHQLRLSAERD